MTKEEGLAFLRQNQPLPSDDYLNDHIYILDKFEEIRNYFVQNPAEEAIPLFLNSFGDGDGYGVYQLVEDTLFSFSDDIIVPYLIEALASEHLSVRCWCAEISRYFPDERLIPGLVKLLNSNHDHYNLGPKDRALMGLSFIVSDQVVQIVEQFIETETNKSTKDFAEEILHDLKQQLIAQKTSKGYRVSDY